MRTRLVVAALAVAALGATPPDPIDRIREADLNRDLFALAGDALGGREGGTLDEMTASAWVGRALAGADKAPAFDPAFKLERCRDFTGSYCGG